MADWLKLFGVSLPFKLYFFCGVWTVQMFTLVLDIKAPIQGVKLWAADGTIQRFRISHLIIHWTVRLWWQHSSGSGLLSHCSLSTKPKLWYNVFHSSPVVALQSYWRKTNEDKNVISLSCISASTITLPKQTGLAKKLNAPSCFSFLL